jgi:hypothetical protein
MDIALATLPINGKMRDVAMTAPKRRVLLRTGSGDWQTPISQATAK